MGRRGKEYIKTVELDRDDLEELIDFQLDFICYVVDDYDESKTEKWAKRVMYSTPGLMRAIGNYYKPAKFAAAILVGALNLTGRQKRDLKSVLKDGLDDLKSLRDVFEEDDDIEMIKLDISVIKLGEDFGNVKVVSCLDPDEIDGYFIDHHWFNRLK